VLASLDDESWRVREMALKVIARHGLDDPTGKVDRLTEDPVERVRSAAWRALGRGREGAR
jgi:HEAT repeat protein